MRNPGIWVLHKAVGEMLMEVYVYVFCAVKWETFRRTEWSQVVDTSHMVVVDMRDESCIKAGELVVSPHLDVKVRSTVYYDVFAINFNQNRGTQSLVFEVCRSASLASAA